MWYKCHQDEISLNVYVQPGAKRTEINGLHGNALKIRLNTPPVDGRANDALIQYLAARFGVTVKQVSLKKGEKSRHKVVVIKGSDVKPSELST